MEQSRKPGVWRFGDIELDERVAGLRVGDAAAELDRSSYDVLLALMRHAGEVVTKDELLEAGWPGRIVSENSLAKAVSRLRHALGGDGEAIRAVHGYGYRLAAQVVFHAVAIDQVEAHPHQAERLHEGDPLPHRAGWRLGRRLGEGSAGVIFLAQSDNATRAIKLATSEAGLRSLKREISLSRYIQGARPGLPHVAPVLGWNLGQPPFFLEMPYYADGHLRDWASRRGGLSTLDFGARLALCVQLCDALAALHQLGIIHKDLKPENLYPVADGQDGWRIVLADLGAGEAALVPPQAHPGLASSLVDGATGATSSHGGSLLYLAPEVIAGQAPTQRSDVYALGMLVYQLLGGDLRGSLAPGWEAAIHDELLREDIAAAAALDPNQRLPDAHALGERLRALDARRARRTQERQQQREQARQAERRVVERSRRRLGLVLTASLGIGLLATTAMYASAERARRQAEQNAAQREAVLQFVTDDILGQADPYARASAGADISVREAVDKAAVHVDQRLAGDPAAAAAVHAMVGTVYFGQDDHAAAIAQFRRARERYLRDGKDHGAALVRVETALCDVYRIGDRLAEAEQACDWALRRARASGSGVALATLKVGQLRAEQGRYPQAQAILRPLLASPELAGDRKAMGELHWALGLAARALGQYDDARRHFEQLLRIARELGDRSTWIAWAYNSLGSVLVETGDYARADPLLVRARQRFDQTQGPGQIESYMPDAWRAEIRLQRGQWHEADAMLRAILAGWEGKLKADHALRLRVEANLAWAMAMGGRRDAAASMLAAALRNRAVVLDRDDDRTAPFRTLRWARAALALGNGKAADTLLDAFDARAGALPQPHPLRAEATCLRAHWSLQQGDRAGARRGAAACTAMLEPFYRPAHPLRQDAIALLASSGHTAAASGTD